MSRSPEALYREAERKARLGLEAKALERPDVSDRQKQSLRSDRLDGVPIEELSKRFGVSTDKVRSVIRGDKQ